MKLSSFVLSVHCVLIVLSSGTSLAADAQYEQTLIDRVYATFASPGPHIVDGIEVHRLCATPLLFETRLNWDELSDETRATIATVFQFERPDLPESYDTPDGLFRIHFARTGPDSVNLDFGVGAGNVPNYILNCADLLAEVVAREIDTMGFRFPPADNIPRPGEDPHYDVYFEDLGASFYGFTYPDTVIYNGAGNPWHATSYLVLHSDYTELRGYQDRPFDAMAVTIAHEFHHASQWAYDAFEAEIRPVGTVLNQFPWWLEASATAMEELIYDHVNDYYGYLPFWFNNPGVSLRAYDNSASVDGLHPYAAAIWPLFLVQRYDPTIVREIWEECGEIDGFNTFDAFETVLENHGSSFREEWIEFLIWNYFTGSRATVWSYEEAGAYPEIPIPDSLYLEFPVADTTNTLGYPRPADELGAAYMRFRDEGASADTFRLQFLPYQPSDFEEWMLITAGIAGFTRPDIEVWQNLDFDDTLIEVPEWDSYDEIVVIATPFKENPTEDVFTRRLGFRFAVSDTLTPGSRATAISKIYSNPLVLSASATAPFKIEISRGEAVPITLRLVTLDGQVIRGGEGDSDENNVLHRPAANTRAELWWDGTTRDGEPVATGIYFAVVQIGDQHEVVKVAVKNKRP